MTFDELEELHYITPIDNMKSILERGILSHVNSRRIKHKSVAMDEIQERRKKVVVPNGKPLHQYVNLYFHARNPMLFKRKASHQELCVIRIDKSVLHVAGVVITDGNASSDYVRFLSSPVGLQIIDRGYVFAQYWNHDDPIEKFRHAFAKCAEVLVPDGVPSDFILGAYVSCDESKTQLYDIIGETNKDFSVTINSDLFFQ
jgi:hypothetical protein